MRKLSVFFSAAFALGGALLLLGATEASAFCSDTGVQGNCAAGETVHRCCTDAAPPNPDDPPPDPTAGLTLCGQVDDLIGGCVHAGGPEPLGPLYVQGCIDGIGAQLPTNPDDLPDPTGEPNLDCANHAVQACEACGCAGDVCMPSAL